MAEGQTSMQYSAFWPPSYVSTDGGGAGSVLAPLLASDM